MVHRTVAGGRTGRRAALAAALIGLVLAGAGLVPAIASDANAGHGNPSAKKRAKIKPAHQARKKVTDNQDHLIVRMAKAGSRNDEDAVATSVGGRRRGQVHPGSPRGEPHERAVRHRTRPEPVDGCRGAHAGTRRRLPLDRRRTGSMRPRPRWLARLLEPSMDTHLSLRRTLGVGRSPRLILVGLLILALAIGAVLVGSQLLRKPSLPQPFGLADNGLLAVALNGSIVLMEPDGSNRRRLDLPFSDVSGVSFSRDGTRIAAWATPDSRRASQKSLLVMNAEGGVRSRSTPRPW